jgi:phosphoglycerate-specific signal transduction histidine kinase
MGLIFVYVSIPFSLQILKLLNYIFGNQWEELKTNILYWLNSYFPNMREIYILENTNTLGLMKKCIVPEI